MLFKSKYIFETRKTRFKRYLYNFCVLLFGLFIFYLLFCLFIIFYARNQTQHTEEVFYQRPPDLIVIFTGDAGRIPFGLKLAKDYQQPNIFITGVYTKNTVESLLKPLGDDYIQDLNLLEIDYLARNTVENALSTLRYLRESGQDQDVLIISHDYHILRIRLIMERLRSISDNSRFYYYGLQTQYTEQRNIKILAREVFKLVRAYAFLLLWDPEKRSHYISPATLD